MAHIAVTKCVDHYNGSLPIPHNEQLKGNRVFNNVSIQSTILTDVIFGGCSFYS